MVLLHSTMFVGPPQTGKKEALRRYLLDYYDQDPAELARRTLVVNCITDPPGTNFVSEILHPFASASGTAQLRAVVFLYADHLGLEAQTALRRCMELHSSTTRFFLVLYDDGQLIAPIRSRLRTRRFLFREDIGNTDAATSPPALLLPPATAPGRTEEEDPIDALERDLCVRQAIWSGLGRLFFHSHA